MGELESLKEKRSDQKELTSLDELNMNSPIKEPDNKRKHNEKCPEIVGNPVLNTNHEIRENSVKKPPCSKINSKNFKNVKTSKNEKISPKKDETKLGINPIEGIADMDAHLRSQMTFVFFCCSSFVMLIVYIGECKSTKLTSVAYNKISTKLLLISKSLLMSHNL